MLSKEGLVILAFLSCFLLFFFSFFRFSLCFHFVYDIGTIDFLFFLLFFYFLFNIVYPWLSLWKNLSFYSPNFCISSPPKKFSKFGFCRFCCFCFLITVFFFLFLLLLYMSDGFHLKPYHL